MVPMVALVEKSPDTTYVSIYRPSGRRGARALALERVLELPRDAGIGVIKINLRNLYGGDYLVFEKH